MCDTVVVVREDQVLFAKNSDRDPNESQILEWHPPRQSQGGATVRCTWIDIPDTPATNAVLISRPYWMWGAEMGANEHGVVIGNEAVFTNQHYEDVGLTGMDLLRLGLERARGAGEAVSVIVGLLERHGQGGGCGHEHRAFTYHNSFIAADPTGAWVLETAGRRWAAERVGVGVRSISNSLTIAGFADRYTDPLRTWVAGGRRRRALTSATPGDATPARMMGVLRSHGRESLPKYSVVRGGLGAPCVHAAGRLAASQTTASWVADLRGDGSLHWVTGTAAPCTALFKPVRVDAPLDLGPAPADVADDSLWWRHERLHREALRDPLAAWSHFAHERDAIERRWLADPPDSAAAFADGDRLLEKWTPAVTAAVGADKRPRWVAAYWEKRNRRAGLTTVR